MIKRYHFLIILSGLVVLFLLFWQSDTFNRNILHPVSNMYAYVVGCCLNSLGFSVSSFSSIVENEVFSMNIKKGCDGLEAMGIFIAATLAFQVSWTSKLKGIIFGIIFLSFLNVARLISLFIVGQYWMSAFEFMHVEFWQVLFLLLTIYIWWHWAKNAIENKNQLSNA